MNATEKKAFITFLKEIHEIKQQTEYFSFFHSAVSFLILFYSFGLDFQKLFLNDRKQKKFNEHFLFIIIDLSEMFSDSR